MSLDRAHDGDPNVDTRSIKDYDEHLEMTKRFLTIDALLDSLREEGIPLRWADYCCGKGVALEQGTSRYCTDGRRTLESLGIDIRKIPGKTYDSEPAFRQGEVSFFIADIEDGVPRVLSPGLATCLYGFTYIKTH
jgi:hypothetical protein